MALLHVKPYKEVYVKYKTPRFGGAGIYAGGSVAAASCGGAIGMSNEPVLFGYVLTEKEALENRGFLKVFAGLEGLSANEFLFVPLENIEYFSFRLVPEDNSTKQPEKEVKPGIQSTYFDSTLASDIRFIVSKNLPVNAKNETHFSMVDEIYVAMRAAHLRWHKVD